MTREETGRQKGKALNALPDSTRQKGKALKALPDSTVRRTKQLRAINRAPDVPHAPRGSLTTRWAMAFALVGDFRRPSWRIGLSFQEKFPRWELSPFGAAVPHNRRFQEEAIRAMAFALVGDFRRPSWRIGFSFQ
jgi:hypothetical protein